MEKEDFLVEPRKLAKAKWFVVYFSDFGDFGVDVADTIKQVNELVRFHQDNSNLFEVYELGE